MKSLPKIDVVPLFPDERAALLDLLRSLTPEHWAAPTVCAGWSVKDIAAHLVADDLGRLGWQRDGHSANRFQPTSPETFEAELRDFITAQNELWVQAARRFSSRVIIDLLQWTGSQTQELFESLDPDAMGLGVSWAGESESANWFDLAREYTERWHHQAQIRDAVGATHLYEPRLFLPLIQTMTRAVPHALHETRASEGARIRLRVTDQLDCAFDVVRAGNRWAIGEAEAAEPTATVAMDGDTAWRWLTGDLPPRQIEARSQVSGDRALAMAVFEAFALVA